MEYYEPTIDEFFEGFEYEAFIPERNCWSVETFYLNESHLKLITHNKIRVKKLDVDDLIELGWKEKNIENNPPPYKFINRVFGLHKWELYSSDKAPYNYGIYKYKALRGYTNDRECCMFWGDIKNKSVLKRTMLQIGMNYLMK